MPFAAQPCSPVVPRASTLVQPLWLGPRKQGSCPSIFPLHSSSSRREPHTTCRAVSSARRGCFSLARQGPAALPDTLLTQLTLLNHPSGAGGGVMLCINPARASAVEVSAAVHAGEAPYPPNLNRDRLASVTVVLWPGEDMSCRVSGYSRICSFY